MERLRQELQRQYALKEKSAENLSCEFNVNKAVVGLDVYNYSQEPKLRMFVWKKNHRE